MKNLICIVCPRGCHLQIDENNNVTGNFCNRGKVYAVTEVTSPTRMITSTVKVLNGKLDRLPVKTSKPVPKDKLFLVMDLINNLNVTAPIKIGDVICENILDLDCNIIATRNIAKRNDY